MRIKLEFKLEKQELPLTYRKGIMSFIKKSLKDSQDGKYFSYFYEGTMQKDFTWSMILPSPQFTKEKILVNNQTITMIMSTTDENRIGYLLFVSLMGQKNKKFPLENENHMTLFNIQQTQQKIITSEQCIFTTVVGAPITVRDHTRESNQDYYYSIADNNFQEKLLESLKRQARNAGFKKEEVESIAVKIMCGKKIIVKHYVYVNSTVGTLEIKAPNVVLQHFYQCGIASRRAEGFGMLEIIAQKG